MKMSESSTIYWALNVFLFIYKGVGLNILELIDCGISMASSQFKDLFQLFLHQKLWYIYKQKLKGWLAFHPSSNVFGKYIKGWPFFVFVFIIRKENRNILQWNEKRTKESNACKLSNCNILFDFGTFGCICCR